MKHFLYILKKYVFLALKKVDDLLNSRIDSNFKG